MCHYSQFEVSDRTLQSAAIEATCYEIEIIGVGWVGCNANESIRRVGDRSADYIKSTAKANKGTNGGRGGRGEGRGEGEREHERSGYDGEAHDESVVDEYERNSNPNATAKRRRKGEECEECGRNVDEHDPYIGLPCAGGRRQARLRA